MATKQKKRTGASQVDRIKASYMDAVLMGDQSLSSIYAFCRSQKISEAQFYKHFNSFDGIEAAIWRDWFERTRTIITNEGHWENYSIREKILSFYYTWFEVILEHRSFALLAFRRLHSPEAFMGFSPLKRLRVHVTAFMHDLVKEGGESGEIPVRESKINETYPNLLWYQFVFLLHFWKNDSSQEFAATDAAIEKSVNLALDFAGRGPIDGMIDFAKFMYQQVTG